MLPVEELEAATPAPDAAEASDEAEPAQPEPIRVPFWRRPLALVVILALIGLIVVLVVWGLAR